MRHIRNLYFKTFLKMDGNKLKNKIALVTGASVGIGAEITKSLANLGMIVIGIARRDQLVEKLNEEIENSGKIIARKCDVTNSDEVINTFKWIQETFGELNVFVNNAGMIKASFLMNTNTEDIKQLFDLNVVSSCVCTKEALLMMQKNQTKGHIILINSVLGHRIPDVPVPLFSVYPSTKFALTALCQTIKQEINYHKLSVKLTSINPGMVDTDFLKVYQCYDKFPKLKPENVAQAVVFALQTPDNVQIDDITLQATMY
ncbi:farnesol dehydrogenase [Condylostylus longicornis]|uniref:farnesol dehydrogenase n=1 Tax=Condylostylus longicornis TaxID=2530218 RepID=UPI00244E3D58|nr:farnesol dehydrogenase [Condylostylus longicornis]